MSKDISFGAGVDPKSASISAVIIRADGTKVELGTVAYYSRNPLKMAWWRLTQFFKGLNHASTV